MGRKVVRRKSALFLMIAAVLAAAILAALLPGSRERFTGDCTKTPDAYILDIRQMTGTDSHTLALKAGDVLQIRFRTEKGALHMEITAPDGTRIYAGNGRETTDFAVNIPETGTYTVTVEARRGVGQILVRVKGNGA